MNCEVCQCRLCRPIGYCIDDPCMECDGVVQGCEPPTEDEIIPPDESEWSELPKFSEEKVPAILTDGFWGMIRDEK